MRRALIILGLMALNSFAFDCLRTTFDLFVASQYNMYDEDYNGYVLDSLYTDKGEGQSLSIKYYRTGNHLDSTIEYNVTPDTTTQRVIVYNETVKVDKEENSKTVHFYKDGEEYQKIEFYFKDDSLYYRTLNIQGKIENLYEEYSIYIVNDTIFENEGSPITVHDSENENRCSVNHQMQAATSWTTLMTYEYETRGDTLIQTNHNPANNQSVNGTKEFYVPVDLLQTTPIISKKIYPVADWKNSKQFDLLGRPAKSEHIIKVGR